jgi:hypothetical protein
MSQKKLHTVFKTTPASNFTRFSNAFVSGDMPPIPHKGYLRYQRLADSSANGTFGHKGYLRYQRLKSGHTSWQVSDKAEV